MLFSGNISGLLHNADSNDTSTVPSLRQMIDSLHSSMYTIVPLPLPWLRARCALVAHSTSSPSGKDCEHMAAQWPDALFAQPSEYRLKVVMGCIDWLCLVRLTGRRRGCAKSCGECAASAMI